MLIIIYAECHFAECRYAECHYAEYCYSDCRGAMPNASKLFQCKAEV
jgi:hypothetical protein